MADNDFIPPTPSAEHYAVGEDQGDVFTQSDPTDLFREWFILAKATEPNDANAMSLATIDGTGLPDVRVVLMKDFNERGISFFTNSTSAKGRQIAANKWGAICFHWKSIRRQVRFRGEIQQVTAAEADAYFATRARGAQIGAWASDQSMAMPDTDALSRRVAKLEEDYDGKEVPRPPQWTGYRLTPSSIEFWVNRPYRLHDRLVFKRSGADWETSWLYP